MSINDCTGMQTDINCIGLQGWCITNFMKQNTGKITVTSFNTKTNCLKNIYKLRDSCTIQADIVKDLGVLIDSKLNFHQHVVYIFSQLIKLWALIHTITYSFNTLDCMFLSYFTLIRPKLEYACFLESKLHLQMPKNLNVSSGNLYPCAKTFSNKYFS